MLEGELAGRTILIERGMVGFHYDIRPGDSSGRPAGDPVARVTNAGGLLLGPYAVLEGDRVVLAWNISARMSNRGPFTIYGGDGALIGTVEADTGSIRSWTMSDAAGGASATAERRSPPLEFLRILLNHLFLEAVPLPYRYVLTAGGREIGSFRRVPRPRRRYALALADGVEAQVDPRLALALAIVLAEHEEVH